MRIVGLVFDEPAPAEPQYTCPVCGKTYKSAKGITDHMHKDHPDYTGEDLEQK